MTNPSEALHPFRYRSGELVKKADMLLSHGESATVEYVVDPDCTDEAQRWHLPHSPSGGIMINSATVGAVFETDTEDLEFLQRGG